MTPLLPILLCALPQQAEPEAQSQPDEEIVVTASAFARNPEEEPWSLSIVDGDTLLGPARTMSESLRGLPSVSVQKTAQGQSSPYLRGLTGYHNLLLVDGVRLNHSAMRPGPNQYWSTVDSWSLDRVELLRGASGVRYGADAVGGIVHAVSPTLEVGAEGDATSWTTAYRTRWASAENSLAGRFETNQYSGNRSFHFGITRKSWGDLEAGGDTGLQTNTGYDDVSGDIQFAQRLSEDTVLRFGYQRVRQNDVPRTHKTVDGISWMGTSVGSELWRLHDQQRDLFHTTLEWGNGRDRGSLIFSLHRHGETRNRGRGDAVGAANFRNDIQGFNVDDFGLNYRQERGMSADVLLRYGVEIHHEKVDSFKREYKESTGVWADKTQGPVAADASYSTIAAYVEPSFDMGDAFTIEPGLRFTHVGLNANEVDHTPSAFSKTWDALTAGIRTTWWGHGDTLGWFGLTQGFRAPSIYDTTSTDETSVAESPDFTLEPEHFLQFELGSKGRSGIWNWESSLWHTVVNDMIVRSPEGSGGIDVLKDNGDGWLQGAELSLGYDPMSEWSAQLVLSVMDGEVDQWTAAGDSIRKPVDRLVPLSGWLAFNWSPANADWNAQAWLWGVGRADELSLRDELDGSRIPANGTPGYLIAGLTWERVLAKGQFLSVTLENLADKDYRVHGSGLNAPGLNLIVAWEGRY